MNTQIPEFGFAVPVNNGFYVTEPVVCVNNASPISERKFFVQWYVADERIPAGEQLKFPVILEVRNRCEREVYATEWVVAYVGPANLCPGCWKQSFQVVGIDTSDPHADVVVLFASDDLDAKRPLAGRVPDMLMAPFGEARPMFFTDHTKTYVVN